MNKVIDSKVLHKNTSSPSVGEIFYINPRAEQLSIQLDGNCTGLKVIFEATIDNSATNWATVEGLDIADSSSLGTNTSISNRIFSFDVSSFSTFRARVETISTGNIKITAFSIGG